MKKYTPSPILTAGLETFLEAGNPTQVFATSLW